MSSTVVDTLAVFSYTGITSHLNHRTLWHGTVTDEGPPWRPLDDASEVVIPKTLPGSIPLPSKQTASGFGGGSFEGGVSGDGDGNQGSMMAFSFSTSALEAAALMKVMVYC